MKRLQILRYGLYPCSASAAIVTNADTTCIYTQLIRIAAKTKTKSNPEGLNTIYHELHELTLRWFNQLQSELRYE